MKRKKFDALSEVEVAGLKGRLIRTRNKTVVLFDRTADKTQFTQACQLLHKIAEASEDQTTIPRIISVDQLVVNFDKGETADYIGCIKASKYHEVVVYEGRNQNLDFLRPLKPSVSTAAPPTVNQGLSSSTTQSGSEKLQQRQEQERKSSKLQTPHSSKTTMSSLLGAIKRVTQQVPHTIGKRLLHRGTLHSHPPATTTQAAAVEEFFRQPPKNKSKPTTSISRTKADMGQIQAPNFKQVVKPVDHMVNAFIEYVAIIQATKTTKVTQCSKILQAFQHQSEGLLKVRIEEAGATIYKNDTSEVIKGREMSRHMVAYSATAGIVPLDTIETRRSGTITYQTPTNDPIVVTTQNTEIWLDDKILGRAHSLSESDPHRDWVVPKITWVNGVPGCGKTTWIIQNFNSDKDLVVTTTTEAKKDLKERIGRRAGADAATRIRTMASVLANGIEEQVRAQCSRLLVDEALMNHFGSIVMISRILGTNELLLIGDVNQLPFIDRDNLFRLTYHRPNHLTTISQELLCTHRCPMDVAYALQEIYSGVYSSSNVVQSLTLSAHSGVEIPKSQPKTLYLTFTQTEKESLKDQGYGGGNGSKVLTIHEAQGLNYDKVIIIKGTTRRLQIHDSVSHAVVAISRHTQNCVYYTDDSDDATGKFIKKAATQDYKKILDYNLTMAIHNRDNRIMEKLAKLQQGSAT